MNYFIKISRLFWIFVIISFVACGNKNNNDFIANKAEKAPVINGLNDDNTWKNQQWYDLNYLWLGNEYEKDDFQGRFKISWTKAKIYLLVEITDDKLIDSHPDGFDLWWDDDCVEVFLDEDCSGGEHQYSHNAFAYHVALDYKVVDFGPDKKPHYYDNHIQTARTQNENTYIWELAISVYNDTFNDESNDNTPVELLEGKKIGFALAYCDNDGSKERENFIGSVHVEGEDKNRGWIDAGIFGTLILK